MFDTFLPIASDFFTRMQIVVKSLQILPAEEEILFLELQTPDSALLIWQHGQNLLAVNHILSRLAESHFGRRVSVRLEINDYLKEKDRRLRQLVDHKIEWVMRTGKEAVLQLNAYERKQAHSYVAEKGIIGLRTYSQGQGADRHLHIASDGMSLSTAHSLADLSEEGVGI